MIWSEYKLSYLPYNLSRVDAVNMMNLHEIDGLCLPHLSESSLVDCRTLV